MRPKIAPLFPDDWKEPLPRSIEIFPDAIVERWAAQTGTSGLYGAHIEIKGLSVTIMDVLLRVEFLDGLSHTVMLRANDSAYTIPEKETSVKIAWTYLKLGVEHILSGVDHLLFVLALLLITSGTWRLVKTITAFTVAHSITLSGAVLGFVHMPSAPVEAMIALSILFLATELVHRHHGRAGLAEQSPWLVSFAFGLLHGFGFAGALTEVGLPQAAIPIALFQFNLGVELGQLMFVALVLLLAMAIRAVKVKWPVWVKLGPAYGIGAVSAFWLIQRVVGFRG
jgi:hydrogenase/urease accessory protein HupE